MIKKQMSILLMLFVSFFTFAEVSVIGITINKDTKNDVLNKYRPFQDNGGHIILNASDVPIEGVRSAVVGFDEKNNKVSYLIIGHNNSQYNYFFELLNGKYKLVKKLKPSSGVRHAEFEKDNVIIMLYSNYDNENMVITYINKELKKLVDEDKNKENQRKLKEVDQL